MASDIQMAARASFVFQRAAVHFSLPLTLVSDLQQPFSRSSTTDHEAPREVAIKGRAGFLRRGTQ